MGKDSFNFAAPDKSSNVLSVYGYTDYRAYLKDYYEFRKDSGRGYSYRSFSKSAGFSSPNILKLVIEGQRNISPEATEKFNKALGLSGQMAEYFSTLVRMNQAKGDTDKEYYFKILKKLTPRAKRRDLNSQEHKYMSHWLFPVIREMVNLPGFRDDPHWISRRLNQKVSFAEINSALVFLIKEGYIQKDAKGKYSTSDNMVISSDEIRSLAIRNFHRMMLEQAKYSLEALDIDQREFGALILNIPGDALEELKYKLKKFRSEVHTWAMQVTDEKKGEIVTQLNFQMYPHTKKVKS